MGTEYHVKVKFKDDWRPIRTVNSIARGFLRSMPDLSRTPPTAVKCPTEKANVVKRIESEESRIPDQKRLRELYDLTNTILCSIIALTVFMGIFHKVWSIQGVED